MTTATETPPPGTRGVRARAAAAAGTAAAGSVIAAEIVGIAGKAAGAAHARELMPATLGVLTVAGVLAGTAGWTVISRRAGNPGKLLAWLVPAVLALSYVPDVAIGVHGTPWSAVATLMVAHAAVFAVTVPVLARLLSPASLSPDRALPRLPPSAPGASRRADGPPRGWRRAAIVVTLGALSAFGPLSRDLYLPSLPSLGRSLGATDALAQLTLSVCMVGLAAGQLIGGPLSDRFGRRRRPLVLGVAAFAVASVLCALAPSIGILIALRLVQRPLTA